MAVTKRQETSPHKGRKIGRVTKPSKTDREIPVRAWKEVCPTPVSGRLEKPRDEGLTMVIDKGLGLLQTHDLLEVAGDYIDFIKLAFGTSAFYARDLLREKVRLAGEYGVHVYPGGTFLEVAFAQGCLKGFLRDAAAFGLPFIEVSDGTIPMSPKLRRRVIKEVQAAGFRVISEVGKKHPADRVPTSNIKDLIHQDLDQGVYKVIVEGRESGKGVVIFRDDGSIDEDELEQLISGLSSVDKLIFEAPLKHQQQDLILRFGPNVNLGNVHPDEILAVEALRVGLRGDTLRVALLSHPDRFPLVEGFKEVAEEGT